MAESQIMKIVQSEEFDEEIRIVDGNGVLPMSSKLIALNPFLDDEHILRVGGRLQHISIPMDTKHPVILPGSHYPVQATDRVDTQEEWSRWSRACTITPA